MGTWPLLQVADGSSIFESKRIHLCKVSLCLLVFLSMRVLAYNSRRTRHRKLKLVHRPVAFSKLIVRCHLIPGVEIDMLLKLRKLTVKVQGHKVCYFNNPSI